MKKTLLIITLLIGLGNLNAQDSTNDATWEETIEFLIKYKSYIHLNLDEHCDGGNYDFNVSNNTMYKITNYQHYKNKKMVYLEELEDVEVDENDIRLDLTGDFHIIEDTKSGRITKYKESHMWITICDLEYRKRLTKAFEHLAYLAGEKRKKSKF